MTVGFVILLIGAFIMVIAAKGTYKYLPPFYNAPTSEKAPSVSEATTQLSEIANSPTG